MIGLERESNQLLIDAGQDAEYPWRTEVELSAMQRGVLLSPRIEDYQPIQLTPQAPIVTICSLTRHLTPHQRNAFRAARRIEKQHSGRHLYAALAVELQVSRAAVYYIMARIWQRMARRHAELASAEPTPGIESLWRAEIAHKRRQTYRRPPHQWLSAYLYGRRSRRRG
jgi:hypothetical protein